MSVVRWTTRYEPTEPKARIEESTGLACQSCYIVSSHYNLRARRDQRNQLDSLRSSSYIVPSHYKCLHKNSTLKGCYFYASARRDSNPRPRPWQGRTPPTEPLAHIYLVASATITIIRYRGYIVKGKI